MHLLSKTAQFVSCAIFSLDLFTMHWELIIEMPQNMYMDFAYIGGCMAFGKQLCVMGNVPNKDLIIAVYEINQSTWLWLLLCLLSSSKHIQRHNTLTYFPNLLATPTIRKNTTTSTHNWYKTIVWPMFLEKGKWSTIFFLQLHSKFAKLTIDFGIPIEKSC